MIYEVAETQELAWDLAWEHWRYIEELLYAHSEKRDRVEIAKFHYLEAFKHGYKHAIEDMKEKQDGNVQAY